MRMGNWNFADIWEFVAAELPDAPCLIHDGEYRTWAEVDRGANGIARHLLDAGLEHQQAVANYMYNRPEYIEAMYGVFKASFVPVNTNYRYTADELLYLWDNADAGAVVFQGSFADTIEPIRSRLAKVRAWLWIDDGAGDCPEWAAPYEAAATSSADPVDVPWGRSGDDLLMLYTGGTTGMPKGVMWRQDDLVMRLVGNLVPGDGFPEDGTVDDLRGMFDEPRKPVIPACPLMHGTGWFSALAGLSTGAAVATLPGASFDAVEFLDAVERYGAGSAAIVGDAFCKPILRALDAQPDRWDISSLERITSAGVMWSQESKEGLLAHHADMSLRDSFASSEALGMGVSISGKGQVSGTAQFQLTPESIVINDLNERVQPGSDEVGRLAVGGRQPIGYYKDPEKSARTFIEIDGKRYSCPGDFAMVAADGSVSVLGRGSVCINTGGEKVFPEEVEEALKRHPAIADAVVVGVPDEKFGEAVTAVVELRPGEQLDEADVIRHVRQGLASYKSPKRVLPVVSIARAPNGKVDYKRLKNEAIEALGVD